jgi:SAM-dependent methyltransferase
VIPIGLPDGQRDSENVGIWEAAYLRFETPEEEVRKFLRRLERLGAAEWSRDWVILDLFCGRGSGAEALRRLGFTRVYGIDLSERLLRNHRQPNSTIVGDCTDLPVRSELADVAIVQGGLHHLLALPHDLARALQEIHRSLRPGALLVVVEPWRTPFLNVVHFLCGVRLVRRLSPKLDALATMIEHERSTYEQWLRSSASITELLAERFAVRHRHRRLGKLYFVGVRR